MSLVPRAGVVGLGLQRCWGAPLGSSARVHQRGLIVLQGKIISLLIKNTSCVLASQPAEERVVRPPVWLYSDRELGTGGELATCTRD